MNTKTKSFASLLWVVCIDSLGWGIAFSVFAAVLFNTHTNILPETVTASSRYMLYEFLLAIYSVFMFFFAPVLGGIADRYGRKPALKLSMLGLTFGFILCALGCYWSNLWLLILGRVISGMTAGSVSVAQAATVDLTTAKTKSFYFSILMLVNTLGFSLGPVLGSLLLNSIFLPVGTTTFLIGAAMSTLGFLSILFLFQETYTPAKSKEKLNVVKDFLNIKIAFSKPILKNYLTAILFSMVAFVLFFSNVPVFLNRQFVISSSETGVILSAEAIIFSMTLMFGGKYIFNYFKITNVILFTQIIQLLAYLLLSLCINSYIMNLILFSCISAFAGVMYIGLLTSISDAAESNWQGRVMGVTAAISSVCWGVGPLLTGGFNHYGAGVPFIFSALLAIIGLLALGLLKKNNNNHEGALLETRN